MDIYSTTNNRYILTEYCEDGDLKSFLSKTKGNLTETEIMILFRGIYQGFKYMNNKGFMHRRINPTNILLKNGICKINNFSMSRKDPGISKKENIPITN
jgi:serine/threonine-protein kinase ULK/ATG1